MVEEIRLCMYEGSMVDRTDRSGLPVGSGGTNRWYAAAKAGGRSGIDDCRITSAASSANTAPSSACSCSASKADQLRCRPDRTCGRVSSRGGLKGAACSEIC